VPGGDLRDIETAAAAGNGDAAITLQTFAYQVRKTIGSYCAAMEGVDTIAFTGGIGENSASLRQHICGPLRFLGVHLHPERNVASGDRVVSSDSSEVVVVALRTNEELIVARRAYRLLASP
jgi:acetate kinase